MAVASQVELLSSLENGDFENIIGTPESYWVDFKRAQYATISGRLQKLSEHGKSELCKDVAAFANNKGGVILIGFTEILSPSNGLSVADELNELNISDIDLAHYKQILSDRIYPLIQPIEMRWFETSEHKGVLAIIIPEKQSKLHIIRQVYDENNKRIRGIEIPVRVDDQTFIHNAESISDLFCDHDSIPLSTTENTEEATNGESSSQSVESYRDQARSSREQLLSTIEANDDGVVIIQAIPRNSLYRLRGFYDTIRQDFTNTTPTRGMGFNLNSMGYETTTEEGALIKSGTRPAGIRLDPNGTLTMALKADGGLLGWGVNQDSLNDFRINPVVLIEMTYEFVNFIYSKLAPAGLDDWEYYVEGLNLRTNNVKLAPGRPANMFWGEGAQVASSDRTSHTIGRSRQTVHTDREPSIDTYRIVEELYSMFTLPASDIPYTIDEAITEESIRSIDARG